MTRQVHILEVTLRFAVVADNNQSSIDVTKEVMTSLAEDGSLSDMHVYEWDDPIHIRVEETDTQ